RIASPLARALRGDVARPDCRRVDRDGGEAIEQRIVDSQLVEPVQRVRPWTPIHRIGIGQNAWGFEWPAGLVVCDPHGRSEAEGGYDQQGAGQNRADGKTDVR